MKTLKSLTIQLVILSFIIPSTLVRGESVSDAYTSSSPNLVGGGGEYVHGLKSGKLLIRTLIFGAVGVQGIHFVPEGTDLLFAILYAGGFSDSSKLNGISIRRRNVRSLIEVDLEDVIEDGKEVPKLVDGDIITIPYNWRRDVGTISLITGFISSLTAFTLSIIALANH